jgi:hypothetical protein
MKLFKRKLNSRGFSHVELGLLLIVVVGISTVGYYVYKHSTSHAGNTYTTLAAIKSDGYKFTEQACVTSQTGSSPNYTDTIVALISVNTKTGTTSKRTRHHHNTTVVAYNPVAYYSINGAGPVTEKNWISGATSTISFDLPPTVATADFTLGVEGTPGSKVTSPGSTQTLGSIGLCNPAPVVPVPTVTLSALPTTVTSGATSVLTWTTKNATSCTASGSWSGTELTAGSYTTPALKTTSTYTLGCTGAGGTSSASATVTVSAISGQPTPIIPVPVATPGSVWQPALNSEWQWEIGQALSTTTASDMGTGLTAYNGDTSPATNPTVYDIDAIENPASTVTALKGLNDHVICYIEVGTAGDYYTAAQEGTATTYYAQLSAAGDLGTKLSGYPENFLNINSASTVSIMESMIQQQCAAKGFNGVETDLDETFGGNEGSTGFTITQANEEAYLTTLANYMHSIGLAWISKDLSDTGIQSFVSDMEPLSQGMIDEQANQYGTINLDNVFLQAGKPIFDAEYAPETQAQFCSYDNTNNINGVLFPVNLNGPRQPCR